MFPTLNPQTIVVKMEKPNANQRLCSQTVLLFVVGFHHCIVKHVVTPQWLPVLSLCTDAVCWLSFPGTYSSYQAWYESILHLHSLFSTVIRTATLENLFIHTKLSVGRKAFLWTYDSLLSKLRLIPKLLEVKLFVASLFLWLHLCDFRVASTLQRHSIAHPVYTYI